MTIAELIEAIKKFEEKNERKLVAITLFSDGSGAVTELEETITTFNKLEELIDQISLWNN